MSPLAGARLDVTGLAVHPDHRGRSLGRALLRAAIASARDRGLLEIFLHVSAGNASAIALYDSEGFRRARLLRRFYSTRHFTHDGDAFEMRLRLREGRRSSRASRD
jgi:ribosomal protein S18 acetylase RimI-like enzyme